MAITWTKVEGIPYSFSTETAKTENGEAKVAFMVYAGSPEPYAVTLQLNPNGGKPISRSKTYRAFTSAMSAYTRMKGESECKLDVAK